MASGPLVFLFFFFMKNNTIYQIYLGSAHNSHKFYQTCLLSLDVSKSTDRMANSVDPDQTAPLGAI